MSRVESIDDVAEYIIIDSAGEMDDNFVAQAQVLLSYNRKTHI